MARQATKRAPKGEEDRAKSVEGKLQGLVQGWETEANRRVGLKAALEQEWLRDLQQFHGVYDEETRRKLEAMMGSKLFQNSTRPKAISGAARMTDILFPTDETNWEIRPTPVPEMALEQSKATLAKGQAEAAGDAATVDAAKAKLAEIATTNAVAAERCKLMQREMEDQMEECRYSAEARDAIMDQWKLGVAIMEGPITKDKVRSAWVNADGTGWSLKSGEDEKPAYYRVDPWSFFPDPDVSDVRDGEGNYFRNLWNAKQLRRFARLPGANLQALRELLTEKSTEVAPSYLATLRNISAERADATSDLYHVWKYSGPITGEEMCCLAEASGDEATKKEMAEVDPLLEVQCIAWFCRGRILKWAIYPLDSGEAMVSMSTLVKDDGSVWGAGGIPRLMRDPQKAKNAAWRMLLDNAGLSTGDQLVFNPELVEPADGNSVMTPRKVWHFKGNGDWRQSFGNFAINSHIEELIAFINLCDSFIDDTTNIPVIAEGDVEGVKPNTTAFATAVLTNSMNVIFKLTIRNWDDDMTVPNLRRLYDWNMQFNQKEWIKGDMQVAARGASVLLTREIQAANTLALATHLGNDPKVGPYIKGLPMAREIFRAHMLDPEALLVSDDEGKAIDQAMAEAAQAGDTGAPTGPTPEEIQLRQDEIEAKIAISEGEQHSREYIAELTHETKMMELAQQMNMSADELAAKLGMQQKDIRAKERSVAVEAALRSREKSPLNQTQIANT